ncbi:HlyD family secretion protein [Thalassoroseus pseudoceratinae]|uniref:HlyD family secretion protein n=1 Tax=Thalassoroseus pseudoceratinae TaxID=2713176 RepID=UPI00141ECB04|nr:efflux RND transporter periplasmic adaptor subunit [Thalassoroseus pseudoceratinae]
MRYLLPFLIGLGLGAAGLALWNSSDATPANDAESAELPFSDGSGQSTLGRSVVAVGRLVPANGVISISGPPEGRIVEVLVEEGESLKKGSPLVKLDTELADLELDILRAEQQTAQNQAEAAVTAAKAQKEAAELQLQQAQLSNPQIDSQQQEISVLEANLDAAEKSLKKMQEIPDLVPSQKIEQQEQLIRSTRAQLKVAKNNIKQLEVGSQQKILLAQSELKLAEANLVKAENAYSKEAFEAQISKAQTLLDRMTIRSPIDGTVLQVALNEGDTIGPRPIMEVANLNPMYCVTEVYESDRRLIREGMSAKITSPAIGGSQDSSNSGLTGTVVRVGQMISRTTLDNLDPFKPQDKHVFVVEIKLDEDSQRVAREFINLQVEVEIETDETRSPTNSENTDLSLSAV